MPQAIANQAKIHEGSKVSLVMKKNNIEIVPEENVEISLEELLSRVTTENIHSGIGTGAATGSEI